MVFPNMVAEIETRFAQLFLNTTGDVLFTMGLLLLFFFVLIAFLRVGFEVGLLGVTGLVFSLFAASIMPLAVWGGAVLIVGYFVYLAFTRWARR